MPCQSDYLAATAREAGSKEESKLIIFVNEKLGRATEQMIVNASVNYYGDNENADVITATLCSLLKGLTEDEKNAIVYDAHNPTSRTLADWYEKHQAADAKREAEDAAAEAARQQAAALLSAVQKLTEDPWKPGVESTLFRLKRTEVEALVAAAAKVAA